MDAFVTRKRRMKEKDTGHVEQNRIKLQIVDADGSVTASDSVASEPQTQRALDTDSGDCARDACENPRTPDSSACGCARLRTLCGENLNCDYGLIYTKQEADDLLRKCEEELEYNTGHLARVHIFGQWHDIPRKQVAHGDNGLAYTFSGNTVPARPWNSFLLKIRDKIAASTGHQFNFVLINRYKDGCDYMGEHRDDEKDLVQSSPIASLSLGQARDFVFRHCDSRGKNAKRKIKPVKIELQHGSLLMMNYPTNVYWYHSLPVRKKAHGVRINMTFRDMVKGPK